MSGSNTSSSSSSCPMKGGGNVCFWGGLVVGVVLTCVHIGMIQEMRTATKNKKKKEIIRAPGNKAWRMSKWVKHNGILRTQGLCGDFSKMPESSVGQQTAEALERLDEILKLAGGIPRKNLLAVTIFLSDLAADFEPMNEVYDKWVDPAGLPTRLCVQAAIGHQAKVEIRAEAYYDEDEDE